LLHCLSALIVVGQQEACRSILVSMRQDSVNRWRESRGGGLFRELGASPGQAVNDQLLVYSSPLSSASVDAENGCCDLGLS
jgi:hypothetical protein